MRFLNRLALTILVLILPVTIAGAQTKIVALVNNEPVTSYQLDQRIKILRLTREARGNVRKQALEELIDDLLKKKEGQRRRVYPAKVQIDRGYAQVARNVKLPSAKALSNVLRQNGIAPDSFKERMAAQMAWQEIVRARTRQSVQITEKQILDAVEDKGEDAKITTEYDMQQIIFVLPSDRKKSDENRRSREARSLRSRFKSCDEGIQFAKGIKGVVVKSIGRRSYADLPAGIRKQISETATGRTTSPIVTDAGVELIAVCDKREIQSDSELRMELTQELRREQQSAVARRFLRDLRRYATIEYR